MNREQTLPSIEPGAVDEATLWWQRGVIYQVYPRSFMDSDGDGIGDLRGILARLDYLSWLGVDAIWLSPIFPSPMCDFGYDVANFTDVDPIFGTLSDFDELVVAAHARGLRVLLDFVPNHSSDLHPWFVESRSSRSNPRRDWYIWSDPAPDGGPPNNWLSHFGGSAWQLDPATGQYYLHTFLATQPDLNWRNPAVRLAMQEAMRFWLNRGVDGFRVDALHHVIKDEARRDNPIDPNWQPGMPPYRRLSETFTADRPEMAMVIAALRDTLDEFPDRMMVGEIYLPVDRLVRYYGMGSSGRGVHLPFNFQLISAQAPFQAKFLAAMIEEYERALPVGGWPNWVLGNHDRSRIASRVGPAQARVMAMLLLTLRGTPTLYYGDELAIADVAIPPEAVQDPWELNVPGMGLGRDPVRTPMAWNGEANGGFTRNHPWLPLHEQWRAQNVESERSDSRSMLSLCRQLLALRRSETSLHVGQYVPIQATDQALVFGRCAPSLSGKRIVVALNLSDQPCVASFMGWPGASAGRIILSTMLDRVDETVRAAVALRADEGVIIELEEALSSTNRS